MAVATRTLAISPDLELPLEAVTETLAILAKRGAGKTYTGSVFVEELLEARLQVVVIDPMGAWWGLRTSADGKGKGYPIAILGGDRDHADLPLEASGGAVVADLLVDERLSAVVDLSAFSKSDRRRFVTDALERLYHRNREAMHVVLEEADLFAPQRPMAGDERMLGAVYDLVRRGRGRGIGSTLITQRSASLSKEVLEQAEILVALRTTGPRDRAAIKAWIDVHGEEEQRDLVMSSLPSLPTGKAWVWWPVEGILRQVGIRQRRTYDSSATPKPGERRAAPKTVADVDLGALQERMAATIERAKADDPKELRKRIRELETQLTKRPTETTIETVEKVVEIPVLDGKVEKLEQVVRDLAGVGRELATVGKVVVEAAEQITTAIVEVRSHRPAIPRKRRVAEAPRGVSGPARRSPEPRGRSVPVEPTATPPLVAARPPAGDGSSVELTGYARRLLETLANRHPMTPTRGQLAVLSRSSPRSSAFDAALALLRRGGYVETVDGAFVITEAGWEDALRQKPSAPTSSEELLQHWRSALPVSARHLLDVLVDAHPYELTRDDLSDRSGRSATSSSFDAAIALLRKMGLITGGRDGMRVVDDLVGGS
jgi:hypothetical protein